MTINDDSRIAVTVARIDENVRLFRNEQKDFNTEFKTSLENLEKKFDGKHEMTQKDINDLDKRVTRVEDFKKKIEWALMVAGGILVMCVVAAIIYSFVQYFNSYGMP